MTFCRAIQLSEEREHPVINTAALTRLISTAALSRLINTVALARWLRHELDFLTVLTVLSEEDGRPLKRLGE